MELTLDGGVALASGTGVHRRRVCGSVDAIAASLGLRPARVGRDGSMMRSARCTGAARCWQRTDCG